MSVADRYVPWKDVVTEYFSWEGMWRALFRYFDPKFREVALKKLNAYYEHPERFANFADGILFMADILVRGAAIPDNLKKFVKVTAGGIELLLDVLPQGQLSHSSLQALIAMGLGDLPKALQALGEAIFAAKRGKYGAVNINVMIADIIRSFVKHYDVNVNFKTYAGGNSRFIITPGPPSPDLAYEQFEALRKKATTLTPEQLARLEAFYEDQKNGHYEEIPGKHVGGGHYTMPTYIWVRDFNPDGSPVSKDKINISPSTKMLEKITAKKVVDVSPAQQAEYIRQYGYYFRPGSATMDVYNIPAGKKLADYGVSVVGVTPEGNFFYPGGILPLLAPAPAVATQSIPKTPSAPAALPGAMEGYNGVADGMTYTNKITEQIDTMNRDGMFENRSSTQPAKEIANLIQTTERELLFNELYHKPFNYGPVPFFAEQPEPQTKTVINLPFKAPQRR